MNKTCWVAVTENINLLILHLLLLDCIFICSIYVVNTPQSPVFLLLQFKTRCLADFTFYLLLHGEPTYLLNTKTSKIST